jgi:hypothetical protein
LSAAGSAPKVSRTERVFELVGRKLLHLAVVALGNELEVGLALLVPFEARIHDFPADRLAVVGRRERVAQLRRCRPVPAERSQLLPLVRMQEAHAIARRFRQRARARPSWPFGSTRPISQWRPSSTTTLPGTISSSDAYPCICLAPLRVKVTTSYLKATGRQLTLVRVEEAGAAARRAVSLPTSSGRT